MSIVEFLQTSPGKYADLHLEKSVNERYNRGSNCHNYPAAEAFLRCAKSRILSEIGRRANCSTPELRGLVADNMTRCLTQEEWREANGYAGTAFIAFVQDRTESCLPPCSTTYYNAR